MMVESRVCVFQDSNNPVLAISTLSSRNRPLQSDSESLRFTSMLLSPFSFLPRSTGRTYENLS